MGWNDSHPNAVDIRVGCKLFQPQQFQWMRCKGVLNFVQDKKAVGDDGSVSPPAT